MSPIFASLDKDGLIQLALHSTTLLAEISSVKSKRNALESILNCAGPILSKNLAEPSIWEFFLNGIKSSSGELIEHNGIKKLISSAIMDTIAEHAENFEPSIGKELLKTLLELSRCGQYFPSLHFLWICSKKLNCPSYSNHEFQTCSCFICQC